MNVRQTLVCRRVVSECETDSSLLMSSE
jgi:hypothetical protein